MMGRLVRRGRRSWRLQFDISANPRVTKYHTLRGTKKEAQEQAAKIVAQYASGQYVDQDKQTVAQFAERWLRDWAAGDVSNKTYSRYEELLRVHVVPRIGAIPIQRLRAADLQRLYAGMNNADRTKLHTHRVVHRMLRHATQ
jgi:hypothetical protein